jgi:hypothetical protein
MNSFKKIGQGAILSYLLAKFEARHKADRHEKEQRRHDLEDLLAREDWPSRFEEREQ